MKHRPVIGLVPAAGRAKRLGDLPCSKEIFPVGFEPGVDGEPRPRPVIHGLLRGLAAAEVERAVVVLRDGKWDVAARLADGAELGLDLAYLAVGETRSVPETLDRARSWLGDHDVALGFPDILLEPSDAWSRLLAFHRESSADVSLGLFPTEQSWKADMVRIDADGRLREIVIKDPTCRFRHTWSIAVWTPAFTEHLHDFVARSAAHGSAHDGSVAEPYVGDVLRSALDAGLDVRGLPFEDGRFLDVGTPADLRRAVLGAT